MEEATRLPETGAASTPDTDQTPLKRFLDIHNRSRQLETLHTPHQQEPVTINRVALAHDYLAQAGGAERVVAELHNLYPQAPIYTSVYDRKATFSCFADMDIRTSYLQGTPLASNKLHKLAIGYYPTAFEQFDFSSYEMVISSSSSFAKGIITGPETCHICYCHTPARFAWRQHEYLSKSRATRLLQPLLRGLITRLRAWDMDSASRVDYFIANSENVARRILKYYRREADAIIYPPVETKRFNRANTEDLGEHFLVVSRLIGYKRVDIAVEACSRLNIPLKVIGTGPDLSSLQRNAGPSIQFLGRLPDKQVAEELARCKALIFPGEEDFGITPLEAMASGRPVIAYGAGGALETVIDGKTGLFFPEQNAESLASTIKTLDDIMFYPEQLQSHASHFDTSVFHERMKAFINRCMIDYRQKYTKNIVIPTPF